MERIREVNTVFLITVIVAISGSFLVSFFVKDKGLNLIVSQLVLVMPSAIYLITNKMNIKESIRLKPISISNIILLILFAFLILPLMSLINAISMLFVSNVIEDVMASISKGMPFLAGLTVIAIIPAIFEETVYRGVFYNQYSKRNALKGIFLSALLFGCLHMNFNQFLYAFVMGAIFVLLVEATDSIISSMIVHFAINGSSATMLYLMPKIEEMYSDLYGAEAAEVMLSSEVLEKSDIISMLGPLAIAAAIGISLAFIVYKTIANNCGRYEHIKNIFKKKTEIKEGNLVDIPLIIGIGGCLAVSILVEVL